MRQKTIAYDERRQYDEYVPTALGEKAILVECADTMTGKSYFKLIPDHGGVSGNFNPEIKRYHGWRGTTNNVSVHAHGLREVIKVRERTIHRKYWDERFMYVTVGKDLHPDWD